MSESTAATERTQGSHSYLLRFAQFVLHAASPSPIFQAVTAEARLALISIRENVNGRGPVIHSCIFFMGLNPSPLLNTKNGRVLFPGDGVQGHGKAALDWSTSAMNHAIRDWRVAMLTTEATLPTLLPAVINYTQCPKSLPIEPSLDPIRSCDDVSLYIDALSSLHGGVIAKVLVVMGRWDGWWLCGGGSKDDYW